MVQPSEPDNIRTSSAWQRVEALLDHLGNKLEAIRPKSDLTGSETVDGLREAHAELRRELYNMRQAERARPFTQVLEKLRVRGDRLFASTTRGARSTYDRVRNRASNASQVLKESLGDLGGGAMRAGRELAGAMAAAVGRFRQRAGKPQDMDSPVRVNNSQGEPAGKPTQ